MSYEDLKDLGIWLQDLKGLGMWLQDLGDESFKPNERVKMF